MRAVLDTNVLISALIIGRKPRKLMNALLGARHTLILSEHIVAEFSLVSSHDKIKRYVDDDDVASFLGAVLSRATFAVPKGTVQVLGDADDDVLDAARAGDADILVTGDKHLLELGKFGRTKVVTVNEALTLLRRQKGVRGPRVRSN